MSEKVYVDHGLKAYFLNIYQYLGLNLLLSGAVSYFVYSNAFLFNFVVGTPFFYVLMFAPFFLSLYLSRNLQTLEVSTVQGLYWLYGVCIGAFLSVIFIIYSYESIFNCFFAAGAIFISAALYGKFTKKDLSSLSSVFQVAIFGILTVMLFNFFIQSSMLQHIISIAVILVFTALIAYDMQALTALYYARESDEMMEKISIIGALQLFISFINIFLSLLELFGNKKNR